DTPCGSDGQSAADRLWVCARFHGPEPGHERLLSLLLDPADDVLQHPRHAVALKVVDADEPQIAKDDALFGWQTRSAQLDDKIASVGAGTEGLWRGGPKRGVYLPLPSHRFASDGRRRHIEREGGRPKIDGGGPVSNGRQRQQVREDGQGSSIGYTRNN